MPQSSAQDLDIGVLAASQAKATAHVLDIIRSQTGMRVVGLAWVREDRWRACAVLDDVGMGLKAGDELDVDTTLCREVRAGQQAIAFDDALADPLYCDHRTPQMYNFRAYCSVPVLLDGGRYFGNLFALDPEPRAVTDAKSRATFAACAGMLGKLIDDEIANHRTRSQLLAAADLGLAREEFLAVVAHDLRNPLATMQGASELLLRGGEPAKVGLRLQASAQRMRRLIDDLVDFTRGRAGTAIAVALRRHDEVDAGLEAVVDEFRDSHPRREFRSALHLGDGLTCDLPRLQQLLSNLLGNAVAYGQADAPIVVEGFVRAGQAVLTVGNWGPVIPPALLERMFDAYYRGPDSAGSSMGLGLSICRQVARAHGGDLAATSSAQDGTRFTLSFPAA